MDVYRIYDVVSINRVTIARTIKNAVPTTLEDRQDDVLKDIKANISHDKYVVKRIGGHSIDNDKSKYQVQWNG